MSPMGEDVGKVGTVGSGLPVGVGAVGVSRVGGLGGKDSGVGSFKQ